MKKIKYLLWFLAGIPCAFILYLAFALCVDFTRGTYWTLDETAIIPCVYLSIVIWGFALVIIYKIEKITTLWQEIKAQKETDEK